jgi:hypothetical protein
MTTISLYGNGITLTCSVSDRHGLQEFMSNPDADVFADFHDKCSKSVIIQGVFADTCQVLVDGESWNERVGINELMTDFFINCTPMRRIINIDDGHYLLITSEAEEGEIFSIEIEDFDETKLVLLRQMYEHPNGSEMALITATYDGAPMRFASPDVISAENSLFDSEENELT